MKELIYLDENLLSPAGGPLGVGYYLHNEALKFSNENLVFLHSDINIKERNDRKKKILYRFPRLTLLVRSLRHIKDYRQLLFSPCVDADKFKEYDAIHFHNTTEMYRQRKNLETFNGIVLLSSHSPIPAFEELYQACATKFEKRFYEKNFDEFKKMDRWCFEHADYIVFPCEDAEEPYYNNWDEFREIKDKRKDIFRYVLTGISPKKAVVSRHDIRERYSISDTDFVISYVGRHNEVKGYGNLKELGKKIITKYDNTKFLIAGNEGPIEKLNDEKWIEVGFTRDPYSLINASDVFVLPNKETYFDLVMLEVLSLGKIVIASRTGGNKYYEKAGVPGVFLYDTLDEAELLIDKILKMSEDERRKLESENRDYFDSNLTGKAFFDHYLAMMRGIGIDL